MACVFITSRRSTNCARQKRWTRPSCPADGSRPRRRADYGQTRRAPLSSPANLAPVTARSFAARDEGDRNMPTVYDFSVSLQRELPFGTILDVAYIGNLQRHHSIGFDLNDIPLGTA